LYQAHGTVEKVPWTGECISVDARPALETAYHGIRRPRYAGDRYAVPISPYFFETPLVPNMAFSNSRVLNFIIRLPFTTHMDVA